MSFPALIAQFSEQAPIATMVRGLLANILSPTELNVIFRETAERQRESPLLFSTVVDLLSLVVSKAHAQERSLFVELVEPFAPGQLWIASQLLHDAGNPRGRGPEGLLLGAHSVLISRYSGVTGRSMVGKAALCSLLNRSYRIIGRSIRGIGRLGSSGTSRAIFCRAKTYR